MLRLVLSMQFKKDLKQAKKRGLKLDKLHAVIDKLVSQKPLEDKYRNHSLTGNHR